MATDERQDIDLRTILRSMWRHRFLVILSFVICVGSTLYFNEHYPPVYEATTTVLFEPSGEKGTAAGMLGLPVSQTLLPNQIQELKSHTLVGEVLGQLGEEDLAVLNSGEIGDSDATGEIGRLIARVRKSIRTETVRGSDVIKVHVTAGSPATAANLANRLITVLEARNLNVMREEVSGVRKFIEDQMVTVHAKLKQAEEDLNTFKEENGVLTLDKESEALLERFSDVEIKYNEVETDLGALQRQLQATEEEMGSQKLQLASSVTDISSPVIRELHKNLVDQQVRFTTLHVQGYSNDHPQMKKLAEEIEATKENLSTEIVLAAKKEKLIDPLSRMQDLQLESLTLEIQIRTLGAKRWALTRIRNDYKKELESMPGKELTMVRLARTKKVNEKIYTMLLEKHEEARIAEAGKSGNVRIIDPARPPAKPMRPRKSLNIVLAALIAMASGSFLAIHLGPGEESIRSAEEAYTIGANPVLGVIPTMNRKAGGKILKPPLPGLISQGDRSPFSESFRSLRTNLHFVGGSKASPRVLTLTSPESGEGKSTVTANLGIALGEFGLNTIMLGADMRKPTLYLKFGLSPSPGLSNWFDDSSSLDAMIQPTGYSNLWIIPVGSCPPNPSEALGSQKMSSLIQELGKRYDVILLDSPPINYVTDGVLMARQSDAVLMVLRAGRSTKKSFSTARRILQNVGANLIGTVVGDVDISTIYGRRNGYEYYYEQEESGPMEVVACGTLRPTTAETRMPAEAGVAGLLQEDQR